MDNNQKYCACFLTICFVSLIPCIVSVWTDQWVGFIGLATLLFGISILELYSRKIKEQIMTNEYSGIECPDCHNSEWCPGPEGSGSQMIRCTKCGTKFCFSILGLERIDKKLKEMDL